MRGLKSMFICQVSVKSTQVLASDTFICNEHSAVSCPKTLNVMNIEQTSVKNPPTTIFHFFEMHYQNTPFLQSPSGLSAIHLPMRKLLPWINNASVAMCGVASSCWLRGALVRYMNDIVLTSGDLQTLSKTERWLWLDGRMADVQ